MCIILLSRFYFFDEDYRQILIVVDTVCEFTASFDTEQHSSQNKSIKMAMFMLCVVVIQLFQSTAGFIIPSFLLSSRQQQSGRDLKLLFKNRIFAGSSYGFLSQPRPTQCSRIFSETSGITLCTVHYQLSTHATVLF